MAANKQNLHLSLTDGDEPVQSILHMMQTTPGYKGTIGMVHVSYDARAFALGHDKKKTSQRLTKHVFHELRDCSLVELSLRLEQVNCFPTHYVNEWNKIVPMTHHFINGIGDSLHNHPTLRRLDFVVDYRYDWYQVIGSLVSCPQLTEITLQFAVHSAPPRYLHLVPALWQLLASSPLVRMKLKDFPSIGEENFQLLSKALTYNEYLKELSITSYSGIPWKTTTPAMIEVVEKAVIANRTLQLVELPIDGAQSLPILKSLECSCSLKKFRLTKHVESNLPDELVAFLDGIGKCKGKTDQSDWEQDPAGENLTGVISLARADLKSPLGLDEERIQKGWLNAIIRHRKDVKFVHYLLSANVSLALRRVE